ncbi:MAG: BatA domain-containing protein [Nevskiaceae bacterium]|jgi:hypothetical protein|nr:BatA domain-containing protein [Nevskiaceae bacterium]
MSWLAPLFIAGLAGLALPLWLHRFARRADEKQPFASLMFLEASEIRRSRRHELRYWLLLALRLALIALLAFAFAGPLVKMAANAVGTGSATLHVVVLDTSLSMRREGVWDRAQQRARDIVEGVRGGDRVMLVAADHRLRVLQEPVFAAQRGVVTGAIASLEPGWSRLDYGALMSGSSSWSASAGENVELHVITDLQQSASPLRFADLQPPLGVTLDLVDAAGEQAPANARVAQIAVAANDPQMIEVRVEGDAVTAGQRSAVLTVNGTERGRQTLAADAPFPQVLRFNVGDLGDGEHRVSATLQPADSLSADDSGYALVRRLRPKVLLVAASVSGDDATYLRAALQSLATPSFDVEMGVPSALAQRTLEGFAAVVVSDAGVMDDAGLRQLRRFVEGGGAALLTLGPRSLQKGGEALTGATLARNAQRAGSVAARVDDMEQSHPMLRDPGGWRSIRFFRHVPVTPPERANVLVRLDSGAPLLLEQSIGNGRVLTLTSPLSREWNDLAIHPLFVRFIAEATVWLAGARAEGATGQVGTGVDIGAGGRSGGAVFDPAGKRVTALESGGVSAGEEISRFVPDQPGYYEVRGGGRSDYIAVNADPRESRLEPMTPDTVQRWLALKPLPPSSAGATASPSGAPQAEPRWFPLWFWLLLGAVLLAFAEPLMANYHLNILRERRE